MSWQNSIKCSIYTDASVKTVRRKLESKTTFVFETMIFIESHLTNLVWAKNEFLAKAVYIISPRSLRKTFFWIMDNKTRKKLNALSSSLSIANLYHLYLILVLANRDPFAKFLTGRESVFACTLQFDLLQSSFMSNLLSHIYLHINWFKCAYL